MFFGAMPEAWTMVAKRWRSSNERRLTPRPRSIGITSAFTRVMAPAGWPATVFGSSGVASGVFSSLISLSSEFAVRPRGQADHLDFLGVAGPLAAGAALRV